MKAFHAILVSTLLAATATAQTQLVRGDVDGIQGTQRFQLECTQIPLISTAGVNLQALHDMSRGQDIEFEFQVIVQPGPTLDVQSYRVIPEIFDMGNLRFGRSESWEVNGTPGSATAVYMTTRSLTGFLPAANAGSWLLGNVVLLMNQGVIGPTGQFRFNFRMPTIPSLVGVEFTAQALVAETGGLLITNPDCKEVRDR